MKRLPFLATLLGLLLTAIVRAAPPAPPPYPWLTTPPDPATTLEARIAPPPGYERVPADEHSFALWLRRLPLKPGVGVVHYFDGKPVADQSTHVAVLDLDIGNQDLQQCADSIIRLRAEWLRSVGQADRAAFHFTSGDLARWSDWRAGLRPIVHGNNVTWARKGHPDDSYTNFRAYLDIVFLYAGTLSLSRELHTVKDPAAIQPGDVFVKGGSPGHAVIVIDMAQNPKTGAKVFLLAQGFMPAQEMHILKNPATPGSSGGPWYPAPVEGTLHTPQWDFTGRQLMRFD